MTEEEKKKQAGVVPTINQKQLDNGVKEQDRQQQGEKNLYPPVRRRRHQQRQLHARPLLITYLKRESRLTITGSLLNLLLLLTRADNVTIYKNS